MYSKMQNNYKYILQLRDYLIDRLSDLNKKYNDIYIITKKSNNFSNHIVCFSVSGIRSEILVHHFDELNIFVSSDSACSSKNKKISETLNAIHLDSKYIDG